MAGWRGAAGTVAVVVLFVQLVWRTQYLAQGYFTQDDYLMLHLGGTSRLGLHYLWQDYAGHLFPGGFLIAYLEAHTAALSWPAAYVPVVLMQLGAGALMWVLLTRLLGSRWERVPLLVVFCVSPLSLWSTQWWAVAIQFLPVELCGLAAALGYLWWRQDRAPWARWLPIAFMVAGLLFQERALLIPLLVLAAGLIVDPAVGVRSRLVAVLRLDRRLWLGFGAAVIGYVLLHAWLAPVSRTGGGGGRQPVSLVANFLFRNVVPGLAGGPWAGVDLPGAAVVPATWVVVVSCGLLACVVAFTARFGGTTARAAWLALLAYVLVDAALVFGGRALFGPIAGLTVRYAADTVPILVVALAGAVRDVAAPPALTAFVAARGGPHRRSLICLAVAVGYVASAAVTSHQLAPDLFNGVSKSYVDTLHDDLSRQPDVVLYDSTVPSDVMFPWFLTANRVSTVIGDLPWAPSFDVPSEQLRIVNDAGHVSPIVLADPVSAYPGPSKSCGYNITLSPTVVLMQGQVPFGKNVLRLGYYTNVSDVAIVTAGGDTVDVPVQPGLHQVDVVVTSAFDRLTVRLSTTSGTVCLASVVAGTPQSETP